jgi:hypothetical protein
MELHRVVIGTDFYDRSLHAVRWAVEHFVVEPEDETVEEPAAG